MTEGVPKRIRKQMGRAYEISQSQLVSWLHCLAYVRNVCAHHGRLWNRELSLRRLLREKERSERGCWKNVYCLFSASPALETYRAELWVEGRSSRAFERISRCKSCSNEIPFRLEGAGSMARN